MNQWRLTTCLLAALFLGACSSFQRHESKNGQPVSSEETPQTPVPANGNASAAPEPTEEQQAAAHALLNQASSDSTPEIANSPTLPSDPVSLPNTSGIPGRSGLRLGHFAPPEEAASASDQPTPRPNAAEQHGLRSPLLPTSLPMDINGKLTPTEGQ